MRDELGDEIQKVQKVQKVQEIQEIRMQEIRIRGDTIRLGQLLKLGGVVESGAEVKDLLADDAVLVNGTVESRRGRQLHDGDVVEVGEWEFRITANSP